MNLLPTNFVCFLSISFSLLDTAVSSDEDRRKVTPEDCKNGCIDFRQDQICGADGTFHDSRCELECLGVPEKEQKFCYCYENCDSMARFSGEEPLPLVCGKSGWRIKTACQMNCDEEEPGKEEVCDCMQRCESKRKKLRPICATNGVVYFKGCYLRCLGLKEDTRRHACRSDKKRGPLFLPSD